MIVVFWFLFLFLGCSWLAADCLAGLAARQTRLNRTLSEGKSRVRDHSAGGDSVHFAGVTLYFVSANGTWNMKHILGMNMMNIHGP